MESRAKKSRRRQGKAPLEAEGGREGRKVRSDGRTVGTFFRSFQSETTNSGGGESCLAFRRSVGPREEEDGDEGRK